MAELLFYQFCEVLVRVAALRYRQLPGLEKRLHALIHIHLIHQVCLEGAPCCAPAQGVAACVGGLVLQSKHVCPGCSCVWGLASQSKRAGGAFTGA